MANEVVTPLHRSDVAQPATPTLATPMEIVAGLREAISSMRPDDVILELNSVVDGRHASQRLSLRCYRKGRLVTAVDKERNE